MDSSQDRQDSVVSEPGMVKTGGNRPRRSVRARLFTMGLGVLVVVLLVAAGTVGLVHYFNHTAKPAQTTKSQLTPEQQAANLQVAGNYSAAQKIYDTQLAGATTNQEKAAAYTGKSSIYISAKNYTAALTSAAKADQLDPTPVNAESLGGIEELLGNKSAAANYYKIAIKRLSVGPQSPVTSYQLSQVQNMLKRVTQ